MEQLPLTKEDAEEYVLEAMMNLAAHDERAIEITDILKPEHFFFERNGAIYQAILDVWKSGGYCDVRLVEDEVAKTGVDYGDVHDHLLMLGSGVDVSAYLAPGYAQNIVEAASRRHIVNAAHGAEDIARDESQPMALVRAVASESMMSACVGHEENKSVTTYDATNNLYLRLKDGMQFGLKTGFRDLDKHFREGIKPKEYWIIAGRPSMGKSAFALRVARNIAQQQIEGESAVVLYITLEMSDEDNIIRLQSEEMNMPISDIYDLNKDHPQWEKYKQVCEKTSKLKIIYNEYAKTVASVQTAYRRCLLEHGRCDVIIIDRVGLMYYVNGKGGYELASTGNTPLTGVSAGLLAFSKTVPIIALSQLSRKVEERADKRPLLSDLRMSGSLEQDAKVVLMMYREHYYNENANPNKCEILDLKNRQGPTGKVELFFNPELTAFYDIDWNAAKEPPFESDGVYRGR